MPPADLRHARRRRPDGDTSEEKTRWGYWMFLLSERPVLTAEAERRFGIPDFVLCPVNTILSFCTTIALGALTVKTMITTGIVNVFLHLGSHAASKRELTSE